ncbi:MAG: histidine--tRNA ligase, partial [Candidatus Dormibacteraeota bacterium]|nr:histidine--tRNA ligase [Candidatus Dormibacteraeota bacterium]
LFARGVGEETDIVEKQMFTFEDRGGRSLTLRPEGTAGAVRAVLGNHLDQELRPVRVHYAGAFFRAESPQRGRYRQFAQLGVECVGERSPALDAEVVEMAWQFYNRLRITGVQLQINTLGDRDDRARYRDALVRYYTPLRDQLCEDCNRRLDTNPLRLLDCKRDARFVEQAPVIWDLIDAGSREFFTMVLEMLQDAGVEARVNHRIVRGLDYYTDTVFEIWHESLQGAQNSLGGGGRYDGLAQELGFTATPGVGYALGVDRTLLVATESGVAPTADSACDVLVCSVEDPQARRAAADARRLRDAGLRVVLDVSERRLDRKLRNADRLQARAAVIVGETEVRDATATVRDLVARSQEVVAQPDLTRAVQSIARMDA